MCSFHLVHQYNSLSLSLSLSLTISLFLSLTNTVTHEDALATVNHALASRSLKQRDLITTIVGIPAAGKTTALCRLFRKKLPERYTSTGVAEQSLRGLLHRVAQMGSWKFVSQDQILEFLAPLLLAGISVSHIVSLAKSLAEEDVGEPTTSSSEDTPSHSQPPSASSVPPASTVMQPAPHSSTTVTEDEKSHAKKIMACHLRSSSTSKEDTVLELIHVVDTGGHPQFMEVMPYLMHNSHVIALVLNLAQPLDAYPQIVFHEEDRPFGRPTQSLLTTRQMIQQCVRTLQAKRCVQGAGQRSKIIVIGTHRDCLSDQSSTIAALNAELRNMFLPAFSNELIVYRSIDEILYPVNSLTPNEEDEEMFEQIRNSISDPDLGKIIDIPPAFFLFEQDTIRYAKQQGRQLVSFNECVEVGKPLKMGQEGVQKALNYFHEHNIFLYFPDVLPDLIFTDPQAPLDFVNTTVAFSYKVQEKEFIGLPADYMISLKKAIITEKMLQHKIFNKCFIPDLYQPHHVITLFTHLRIIAPLHDSDTSDAKPQPKPQSQASAEPTPQPSSNKRYLMPCLLPDLTDFTSVLPTSPVAVFVVHFKDDCVPNGTFSGSLSCLLSDHGWKICPKADGTPQCLAHNVVTLRAPNMPANITYVNATRHLELHVECPNVKKYASIFPRIRNAIFSAIHATFSVMHFEHVTIEDAFLCNCHESKLTRHAAKLCHFEQSFYLECTKASGFDCELKETHTVWIQGQEGGKKGKCI